MKSLLLVLVLISSCTSYRRPAHDSSLNELSFRKQHLDKDYLRRSYPHLSEEVFEVKFNNSLERPLLFFRSYVNTYYQDTLIRGSLRTPVFCLGDAHPENFGFISFQTTPYYVFNDIDDSGICPIGLDILRYFSALRLTIEDEKLIENLAEAFVDTINGKKLDLFSFKRPDLIKENLNNLKKYTRNGQFIERKNLVLLTQKEKKRLLSQINHQLGDLKVLDMASYHKNDGGSAGLSRYWLVVETPEKHRELIEFKETTQPAVIWSGHKQNFDRSKTPQYIWGTYPDYYGYIKLDNTLYMTRTRADDYIDLNKLNNQEQFKLLKYQVQLLALFHRDNLNKLGGINKEWLILNSKLIAQRYQETFAHYKR